MGWSCDVLEALGASASLSAEIPCKLTSLFVNCTFNMLRNLETLFNRLLKILE
jgi:hypothetical protein